MTDTPAIIKLLNGCVDLHCHSGPNPFPRRIDHAEAGKDGERLGMRGVLVKSHHHNTVMDLLAMRDRLARISTPVFGGITLNSMVGGINPHAVAMSLRMGGRAVWFPTFSAGRHIDCHPEGVGFPTASVEVPSSRVDIRQEDGELIPQVHEVLDLVKESDAMVTGGHMETESITHAVGETRRRRELQAAFNREHGITPRSASRAIMDIQVAEPIPKKGQKSMQIAAIDLKKIDDLDSLRAAIEKLRAEMRQAAADLEFERAAALRDKARELEQLELQMR